MESFSDGVIAVAITLLVLNISVPEPRLLGQHGLAHALLAQWQIYAAYVISFVTIPDLPELTGRRHLGERLLTIGVLPFSTSLLATYLKQGEGQNLAAGIYAGSFLLMSIAFATLNSHILLRKAHWLHTELPIQERRRILTRSLTGLGPYAIATALAVVSPYITLVICALLALFYASPIATGVTKAPA